MKVKKAIALLIAVVFAALVILVFCCTIISCGKANSLAEDVEYVKPKNINLNDMLEYSEKEFLIPTTTESIELMC